jgi:hypothetical protein
LSFGSLKNHQQERLRMRFKHNHYMREEVPHVAEAETHRRLPRYWLMSFSTQILIALPTHSPEREERRGD